MYRKHPFKERLYAVQKCLAGFSKQAVAHELNADDHEVSLWLARYEKDGSAGLQKKSMKRTNFAEKCKIVCEFVEKGVPLHQICAEHHISRYSIQSWLRVYRAGGYEALHEIKPQGTGRKGMGRPKKQEPQTELERLRYENEYLRAEVALLKKVRALVEEREKRLHEIGRKPSKH